MTATVKRFKSYVRHDRMQRRYRRQKSGCATHKCRESVAVAIPDTCHELKTPLTIVMGYLDAIDSGLLTDPEEVHRVLERARKECRRMRNTIAKLTTLARLDAPSEALEDFDAADLAAEVVDSMKSLSSNVHLDVASDEEALVSANRDELREALIIAIDNALKYAPNSQIDVRVMIFSRDVTIEIIDAGPGMTAYDLAHAFERFHRGSTHANVEGSGLGLAIAKRSVERAGGRIALLSELGRGTTVRMSLPLVTTESITQKHQAA